MVDTHCGFIGGITAMKTIKKILTIFLVAVLFLQAGCYYDIEKNSLNEYISCIKQNKCGFSSTETDHPDFLLPSISFFDEFKYIEGSYYWREDDPLRGAFTTEVRPEISLIRLKYEASEYSRAKEFMLQNIEPYNNKFYTYNSYVFYKNSKHVSFLGGSRFPKDFTMACYNDENYTLIFIGLYSGTLAGPSCIDKVFLEDIENNWKDFIDKYYGDVYDFSK